MKSDYALETDIRYYGIIPTDVRVENGAVTGSLPPIRVGAGMQSSSEKPFDLTRWKEPPHLVLANLRTDDFASVAKFTREYGYLAGEREGNRYRLDLKRLIEFQKLVRDTWRGLDTDSLAIDLDLPHRSGLRLSIDSKGSDLGIDSLRTLIEILVLRDVAEDRVEICDNRECLAPYFLKVRQGQKFCSHPCATLINVHRFRARQKKAMRLLERTERSRRRVRS